MAIGQCLLYRMQVTAGTLQAFHREHGLAIHRRQLADAGVDRFQAYATGTVRFAQHHRACTAIALCATLLGTGQAQLFAEVLQQRDVRVNAIRGMGRAVQYKTDCLGRGIECHASNYSDNAATLWRSRTATA